MSRPKWRAANKRAIRSARKYGQRRSSLNLALHLRGSDSIARSDSAPFLSDQTSLRITWSFTTGETTVHDDRATRRRNEFKTYDDLPDERNVVLADLL